MPEHKEELKIDQSPAPDLPIDDMLVH